MKAKMWFPYRESNRCPNCRHVLGEVRLVDVEPEGSGSGNDLKGQIFRQNVCPGCDRNVDERGDVDWSRADTA